MMMIIFIIIIIVIINFDEGAKLVLAVFSGVLIDNHKGYINVRS